LKLEIDLEQLKNEIAREVVATLQGALHSPTIRTKTFNKNNL
jgi:hypothetical protein